MRPLSGNDGHNSSSGAKGTHGLRDMTRQTKRSARRRDERGSVAIEAAIGVPAFGLFVAMIILGGRVEIANQAVDAAAYEAARAASIERTQSEAISSEVRGHQQPERPGPAVHDHQHHGQRRGVQRPAGNHRPGHRHRDLQGRRRRPEHPGLPGTRTITATASSPVDAYRERR